MARKRRQANHILIFIMFFLAIGGAIGYVGASSLTKNDTFEIIGDKNIVLNLNSTYKEEGVKVISYGKDLSNKVEVETNLDISKAGDYYVIYTVKSLKYNNIKRIRYIRVIEGE